MNKVIAMIPARLGSKRVKNKNLKEINGKPLISYIVETAVKSNVFDEIYINSESEIFKDIADKYGIKFYKRPEELSTDSATNDQFALDFIENNPCDTLVQLLSTSPFLRPEEIDNFVNEMTNKNYETFIAVNNIQIECIYDGKPLNFNQKGDTLPSQQLKPVQAYACGIMGWTTDRYIENINKFGSAYHGGDGRTGFFELSGYSTIDIDSEEKFRLAELVSKHLEHLYNYESNKCSEIIGQTTCRTHQN